MFIFLNATTNTDKRTALRKYLVIPLDVHVQLHNDFLSGVLDFSTITTITIDDIPLSIRVHLSPESSSGLLAYASGRCDYNFPHICG